MAVLLPQSSEIRLAGVARPHYKWGFNFVVDANGNYVPQRNARTLFEYGVDDTNPVFTNAGYSDTASVSTSSGNIEMTTARRGGGVSNSAAAVILAISFLPEHTPRVGLLADGTADGNFTAAIAPRRGGLEGDVEAQIMGRLYATAMKGAQMSLLPTGNQLGCSLFMGIPQLTAPGTGHYNSEIPSMGLPTPSTRFSFGDDLIVFPSRNVDDFKPNRVGIDWPTALAADSTNDEPVELPAGAAARAAGTVVTLDMIAILDFALVKLLKADGTEVSPTQIDNPDIAAQIDHWEGLTPLDTLKITSFRRCF